MNAIDHDSANELALDTQLCFALYAATHLIQHQYRPILSTFGLTYPQFLVLLVLWEDTPQSVTSIGNRLGLKSSTLTPILQRMQSAGLVKRVRSAEDERRVDVHLTDHGFGLRPEVESATEAVRCAAAAATSDTQALHHLLQELRDDFSKQDVT